MKTRPERAGTRARGLVISASTAARAAGLAPWWRPVTPLFEYYEVQLYMFQSVCYFDKLSFFMIIYSPFRAKRSRIFRELMAVALRVPRCASFVFLLES